MVGLVTRFFRLGPQIGQIRDFFRSDFSTFSSMALIPSTTPTTVFDISNKTFVINGHGIIIILYIVGLHNIHVNIFFIEKQQETVPNINARKTRDNPRDWRLTKRGKWAVS